MLTLIHIEDTTNLNELKNALIEMGDFNADIEFLKNGNSLTVAYAINPWD